MIKIISIKFLQLDFLKVKFFSFIFTWKILFYIAKSYIALLTWARTFKYISLSSTEAIKFSESNCSLCINNSDIFSRNFLILVIYHITSYSIQRVRVNLLTMLLTQLKFQVNWEYMQFAVLFSSFLHPSNSSLRDASVRC